MDLLLATHNAHKTREIQRMLGSGFAVRDLADYPEIPETAENGKTFEENAILKAVAVSKRLPGFVFADDSGLEVDALDGAPGIYSARYAGPDATDQKNIDKLLCELARIGPTKEKRSARFRCVLALARADKILGTFEGVVEGMIVDLPRGREGFGYDPIFKPNGFDQTFGELSAGMKDQISHRAKAAKQVSDFLKAAAR